jgi:O-antigen/teichoic acid export membrane protein
LRRESEPEPLGAALEATDVDASPPLTTLGARLPLRQGAWALADQVLSSATNFALSLFVARWLAPKAFGSFALAIAAWITLLGLCRAALVQPYVVEASRERLPEWRASTRSAGGAVLVAGICGGAVIALVGVILGPGTPTGQAFVILGGLAPFLVVQDFWRFAAFSRNRARAAVANDGLWAIVQAAFLLLIVRHHATTATAMVAWGAGAVAGAFLGTLQFRLLPSLSRATLRWARRISRWGGWFGLSNGLYAGGNQAVAVIVAAGSGPAALGGLRGVQTLLGPAQLVAQSGDAVALPAGSRHYAADGNRGLTGFAVRYGVLLTVLLGGFGAVLVIGRSSILRFVLGPKFVPYGSLVLPLALGLVATSWSLSSSVALRSALKGRQLAQGEALGAVSRIVLVAVLLHFDGVVGAAWGVVLGSLVHASGMWWLYLRASRTSAPPRGEVLVPTPETLQPQ